MGIVGKEKKWLWDYFFFDPPRKCEEDLKDRHREGSKLFFSQPKKIQNIGGGILIMKCTDFTEKKRCCIVYVGWLM